jgi:hypothetical protein
MALHLEECTLDGDFSESLSIQEKELISEALWLEKLGKLDNVRDVSHVDCYTPLSDAFRHKHVL